MNVAEGAAPGGVECIEKTHQRLQQALQAAAEHKQRADSNHRALEDSRQQLRHFEKLLRGRSDDLNLAVESERSMQMQVSEAEERAKTLVRELADEQRRSEYLAQQLSSPKEKSAHGHCLGSELEMERNSHLALQARNKKLEAEVGELKRRCSALEKSKMELDGLKKQLSQALRAKAEAIATASSAVAEADALRSLLAKATKDREAAVRHAQAQEEDLDAEKAKLQHKVDELEEERVSLQDNLTAVRAAGILSKSGTLRFDFNGLTCPSPSRPSTASVEPDEKYRLKKQVMELQDRLRVYQAQEHVRRDSARTTPQGTPKIAGCRADARASTHDEEQAAGQAAPGADALEGTTTRMHMGQERAAATEREASLAAELERLKMERSQANKRADSHSRQLHELQIRLRDFQQAQQADACDPTCASEGMEDLRNELQLTREILAEQQEQARRAQVHVSQQDMVIAALQERLSPQGRTATSRQAQSVVCNIPSGRRQLGRDGRAHRVVSHKFFQQAPTRPTTAPTASSLFVADINAADVRVSSPSPNKYSYRRSARQR